MMKDIKVLDLQNGTLFINFGGEYAHIYEKSSTRQIAEDFKAWEDEHDCSSWDNNEIEYWEQYYNDDTTQELNYYELMEQVENTYIVFEEDPENSKTHDLCKGLFFCLEDAKGYSEGLNSYLTLPNDENKRNYVALYKDYIAGCYDYL